MRQGVGYYALWRLCNLPATGLAYIIGRVMFPVYTTLQDDRAAFREAFLANIRRVALVTTLPIAASAFSCVSRSSTRRLRRRKVRRK